MSIFASSFRIVEEISTGVCFTGFFAGVLEGVIGMGFWRRVADADEATSEIIYQTKMIESMGEKYAFFD